MQIARRYARALYEEAESQSKTDQVDEDVELIRESLENVKELRRFFESPIASREKKLRVVRALFKDRLDPLTLNFLELLIEKQRETHFPQLAEAYRGMRDEQLGIVRAQARVAVPLGDADHQNLVAALERMTGKSIRLEVTEDEDLMGGVVIRVGDTVYDGSVRNQLSNLREQMERGGFALN